MHNLESPDSPHRCQQRLPFELYLRSNPCGISGGMLDTNHLAKSILIFPSGGAKMSFNKRGD